MLSVTDQTYQLLTIDPAKAVESETSLSKKPGIAEEVARSLIPNGTVPPRDDQKYTNKMYRYDPL
jgi:hypothetical protein